VLISVIALFGAIHGILVAIPGLWRSWMIVIEPIEGMVLGPGAGFTAALIGSLVGRIVRPRPGLDLIFGIAEPVGALAAGLMFTGRWKATFAVYAAMLAAYFIHPLGRTLPAWCLWDVYIAFALIFIAPAVLGRAMRDKADAGKLLPALALTAFIGIEADVLTRIFIFIPLGFYKLMGITEAALPAIWVAGAVETPIESVISVIASVTVGVPLLVALTKGRILNWPLTGARKESGENAGRR